MSSRKGSAFERDLCKLFSLWWSGNTKDDVFWRTAGSGARATVRMKSGKRTADSYGDMKADDIMGKDFTKHVLVEFKRGYSNKLTIGGLLDSRAEPLLVKWWVKAEKQREQCGRKRTLIVYKRDRRKTMVVLDRELFSVSQAINNYYPPDVITLRYEKIIDVAIIRLDDFFKLFQPPRSIL